MRGESTSADLALAFYASLGFDGDRTRKNLFGYPGLLRELSNAPPWMEAEPEDLDDDLESNPALELRPLILQAQSSSDEELITIFRTDLESRNSSHRSFIGVPANSPIAIENRIESFRRLLSLARSVGSKEFGGIYDAVFDVDEFDVRSGAPDLLLWLSDKTQSLWFFSEIKAPGDYLGSNQKLWLYEHWETMRGHYCLTILE